MKIYPDTGHFIHTDNPVQFAADVVDFVELGNVVPNSPVAIDRLVNGASNEEPSVLHQRRPAHRRPPA